MASNNSSSDRDKIYHDKSCHPQVNLSYHRTKDSYSQTDAQTHLILFFKFDDFRKIAGRSLHRVDSLHDYEYLLPGPPRSRLPFHNGCLQDFLQMFHI